MLDGKVLSNKAFAIATNLHYDGYRQRLLSMVYICLWKRLRNTTAQTGTGIVSKDHQLSNDLHKPITKKLKNINTKQAKKAPLKLKAFFKWKLNETSYFFSTLQLTCNIRYIRKFYFKIVKDRQDIAFCVESFKFELYKNLKRTDARKLSFNSLHIFYTCPVQCKVCFYEILCCVTFHCVLCDITLHYKLNGHCLSTNQKGKLKVGVPLTKKNNFFKWR